MIPPYLVLCLLSLLLTSMCNALLASFTISGTAGIDRLRERFPASSARLQRWEDSWSRLQATHLLLTVSFQVTTIITAFLSIRDLYDHGPVWAWGFAALFLALYTLLVKVLPIAVSENFADRMSVAALPATGMLSRLLFPVTFPIAALEQLLHRRLETHARDADSPSDRDEILSLMDDDEESDLDEEEKEIIRSVFDFGETIVREIMTPRVNIEGIETSSTIQEAAAIATESRFSRFPVYHDRLDDITGLVHVKDILRALREGRDQMPVSSIQKQPIFVPESMPISDLLALLKRQKHQSALVVDEYGGTAGVVTIEDIVEELVGEIEDEYDMPVPSMIPLKDGSHLVEARTSVSEINDALTMSIPEREDYDSLGGYIFYTLGRIPKTSERVPGDGFELIITKASPRQIQQVKVIKVTK